MVKVKGQNFGTVVSVMIPHDDLKELRDLAKTLKLTQSQIIRNMICIGLDDARIIRKIGLVDLIGYFRKNDMVVESADFIIEK